MNLALMPFSRAWRKSGAACGYSPPKKITSGFLALIGVRIGSKFARSSVPSKPSTFTPSFFEVACTNSAMPCPYWFLLWTM
jgi:hypothetical protein